MQSLSPKAELMKLEYNLDISRRTSQGLLRIKNKTKNDIKRILWECLTQIKLLNNFKKKEAAYTLNTDQRYILDTYCKEAENTYYDISTS